MRVFLDTNVFFSAIASYKGFCAEFLDFVLDENNFVILTNDIVIQELEAAIARKLDLHRGNEIVDLFFAQIYKREIVLTPEKPIHTDTLDINDALILAAAVNADADFLITGDGKLLKLKTVKNTRIMKPRDFYDQFIEK